MAQILSAHNQRIARLRELRERKGRREHNAFTFEGATLLEEAQRSGATIDELYATEQAYDETPLLRAVESQDVPLYLVDERTFAKISDVESPSGILAVGPQRFASLEDLVAKPGVALVLADLNDPGNAGTLLRSADAFGATGVVFGDLGVDPYHPKVVRGAMGSLFRVPVALAQPEQVRESVARAGSQVLGLDSTGGSLAELMGSERVLLVVGHEKQGLGRWRSLCERTWGIPMHGEAESLNAAVAASIALYELTKH